MLSLVVLRHARTVNNHPTMPVISSGVPGPAISPEGMPHARHVSAELRQRFEITAVYTSPLRRAIQTAELVAAPLGLALAVKPALIECNVGSLENRSDPADFDELNSQLAQWRAAGGRSVRLGGDGDSGDEVRARILGFLESLDWDADATGVAVSHALALSSLMNLCGIDLGGRTTLSERFPENCGWALITRRSDGFYVSDSYLW